MKNFYSVLIGILLFTSSFNNCFAEENAAVHYKKISANLKGIINQKRFCAIADAVLKGEWKDNKDRIKKIVLKNGQNLEEFKRAAFLGNYDASFGKTVKLNRVSSAPLPSYKNELILARLSLLQAKLFAQERKFVDAATNYISVLKLADQIRSQTTFRNLVNGIISLVVQNMVFTCLVDFLNYNPDIEIYQRLISSLRSFKTETHGLKSALEGEFEFLDKMLPQVKEMSRKELRNIKDKEEREKLLDEMFTELQRLNKEARSYILTAVVENDLDYYNNNITNLFKKTTAELKQHNIDLRKVRNIYTCADDGPLAATLSGKMLFLTSLPYYGKVITKHYVRGTELKLLETAYAVKSYKIKKDKLPISLKELVPAYLTEIPIDDFNRPQPLKYKLSEQSCLIYSIGPDRVDNQASQIYDSKKPDEGGDIVLKLN